MPLYFYNSLTRQKEEFKPINSPRVLFYSCGPTVYGKLHVGNARTFVSADLMRRWLTECGYEVRYVQNITDVDDKIIKRAQDEGRTSEEVAEEYTQFFLETNKRLGFLPADENPRATQYIGKMIGMIKKLESKGHAYASEDGSVWFHVPSFPEYGKLSNLPLDQIQEGERVDPGQQKLKRDSRDFALWKAAKPGEPAWKSPWGEGRPGWHIECSVMAIHALGADTIDIHSGGSDLRFPHHENEIAQSECCTGHTFSRYWIHSGMLDIDGEKMSKSLGNIKNIDALLDYIGALTLRYFLISARYRDKLDFTEANLNAARSAQERIVTATREAKRLLRRFELGADGEGWRSDAALAPVWDEFSTAMNDDFNTPRALGALNTFVTSINQSITDLEKGGVGHQAAALARKLGMLQRMRWVLGIGEDLEPADTSLDEETVASLRGMVAEFGNGSETAVVDDQLMERLIALRAQARKNKDFAAADQIRTKLQELGILLEDKPGETIWRKV